MTPSVVLLLSMLILRGRGCDELKKGTVRNLQDSIRHENSIGFLEVFPKNYVVSHFNASAQCQDQSATCCMFSKAVLLSHSWAQLLQHLERVHFKHRFISELKLMLDEISKEGFQETPDPSVFPSVNSSPGTLLTFTSSLLSKWLELNCPAGENACVFPTPFTTEEEEEEEEEGGEGGEVEKVEEGEVGNRDRGTGKEAEGNTAGERTSKHLAYGTEGERGKRWITVIPTNGDSGLSASAGLVSLCALHLLRGW
ncbi:uncharacterized protein [Salminus brasiliensis]|uniref:uncharacterized protein n=1 Tax=Salminus brasiliensis TaxID=930266 RepID=UPI003B83761B